MDADHKSTVSSFYGGRKTSFDALNSDFPPPTTHYTHPGVAPDRVRRDSSSSFFNPERGSRASADLLNDGRPSLGYNRESFFPGAREEPLKGGRDEEEEATTPRGSSWDVYADFNNTGPRYSSAFGKPEAAYQPIPAPSPKLKVEHDEVTGTNGPVEMVTVPALGAEWARSELNEMTKSSRKKKKFESRKEFWKRWNRGEVGMCGRWFNKRTFVFFMFGLISVIAIVLAFTIPRVPSFAFSNNHPLANATGAWKDAIPVTFNRLPANFSFPAFASLQADTGSNFLPLRFNHLRAQIFDLQTVKLVAQGDLGKRTIPAKAFTQISLPLNFTYVASNDTDQTWKNWYNACRNSGNYVDGKRPGVQFRLILDMDILGLPGSRKTSTEVTDANCPIELSLNSI